MKKFISIGIFALALTAGAANAAQIFIHIGPPPPRREVIVVRPGPRYGWARGYDDDYYEGYRGRRCDRDGYWERQRRPRAVWVPGYWAPRRHSRIWISGYWRY